MFNPWIRRLTFSLILAMYRNRFLRAFVAKQGAKLMREEVLKRGMDYARQRVNGTQTSRQRNKSQPPPEDIIVIDVDHEDHPRNRQ